MKSPKLMKSAVIAYFGGVSEAAKAIGVKPPSVCGWGEYVPARRAYEYERITNGELKPEYVEETSSDAA